MRTISYKLDDLKKAIIRIGYVGENQHTQVRLDCKDLFKEYPDAAASMAIVSPAGQSYPKVVTVDGSTVVWDVTDSDLAAEGDGEIQLTFTEGGVVAKTAVARFNVYRSIAAEGPAPDPVDDWLQEASEALEDIEAAEVNQPIIGQDGYWYTWDQEAGEYVKTNTKAQGEDGQPGHTPEKGVDYWTAADKAEMESDVAGAIIDDTSTALNKTWSASKSNTLLSAITAITDPSLKSGAFITENDFDASLNIKTNVIPSPFQESDVLDESYIMNNGTITTGGTYYKSWCVSPLIPISSGGLYGLKVSKGNTGTGNIGSGKNGYSFFGSDGETVVSRDGSEITEISTDIYTIDIPNNAKYIRFSVNKVSQSNLANAVNRLNQWILLPNATPDITEDFFILSNPKENGTIDRIKRADGSYLRIITNELPTKNILVFGDSIWGNDRTDGVADFLAEYSGAKIYNCAVGGTRITGNRSQYSSPEYKPFDGVNLIHALIEQDWTEQDATVDEVASYVKTETLPLLKTIDLSKIDIVILSYGTNDYVVPKSIADVTNAFLTAISEILTAQPKIRVLCIVPPWRMFSSGTVDGDEYENGNGDTLQEYNTGIVAGIKAKHIETLNMLDVLPWRAETKEYYLDSDSVHPNTNGNKVYAHVVNGKLNSMY